MRCLRQNSQAIHLNVQVRSPGPALQQRGTNEDRMEGMVGGYPEVLRTYANAVAMTDNEASF